MVSVAGWMEGAASVAKSPFTWRKRKTDTYTHTHNFSLSLSAPNRAAIATFESPMAKKNTYVHIEPNRTVKDLAQTLLQRESAHPRSCPS